MIRCERRRKATDAAQQLSRARHDGVQQRTFRCHGLLTGARNILRASDGLLHSSALSLVAVQFACLRWEFILHVDRLSQTASSKELGTRSRQSGRAASRFSGSASTLPHSAVPINKRILMFNSAQHTTRDQDVACLRARAVLTTAELALPQ